MSDDDDEALALAIDYLSRATGGIQSDVTDAAATLVNVGDLRRVLRVLAALPQTGDAAACHCPPCPGRGNDGHGMTHCAECCFGSHVEADEFCPVHGRAALTAGANQ